MGGWIGGCLGGRILVNFLVVIVRGFYVRYSVGRLGWGWILRVKILFIF